MLMKLTPGEMSVRRNFVGGTKDFLSPETLSCYVFEEGSLRERQPLQEIHAIIGYKSDIW